MGEKQGEGRDRGINLFFTDSFQQEGQTVLTAVVLSKRKNRLVVYSSDICYSCYIFWNQGKKRPPSLDQRQ